MKKVKQIKGLRIMEITKRDIEYDEQLAPSYIVVDADGEEISVGADSLETQIEFARCYR